MSKKSIISMAILVAMGALMLSFIPKMVSAGTEPLDLGITYAEDTGLTSTDVRTTVARIIRVAMGLLGIVAVVIILVGGFKWMTAGGNEDQVGEAKSWIFSGVIGLVIILSAYALATFIINQLQSATAE